MGLANLNTQLKPARTPPARPSNWGQGIEASGNNTHDDTHPGRIPGTDMNKSVAKKRPATKRTRSNFWELRLYIAGQTPNSIAAIANLKKICEDQLKGKYRIEVIDLLKKPQLAKGDQIVAIPTLVRRLPPPVKKIVGNLSKTERALVGWDIQRGR